MLEETKKAIECIKNKKFSHKWDSCFENYTGDEVMQELARVRQEIELQFALLERKIMRHGIECKLHKKIVDIYHYF